MRLSPKWLLPITLLATACATSTPIAVPTPTYHVPAVDSMQRQGETQALSTTAQSLCSWQKLVTSLPGAQATSLPPCKAANVTEIH